MRAQAVICRYNEDVAWVHALGVPVVIYNKGADLDGDLSGCDVIRLENVGREAHAFLWHVVHNWNDLADVTVFLHGDCGRHSGAGFVEGLAARLARIEDPGPAVPIMGELLEDPAAGWIAEDLRGTYAKLFGEDAPGKIRVWPTGQWIVPRSVIHARPLDLWRRCLKMFEDLPADQRDNPRLGFVFERLWAPLYGYEGE
jgi:hypothetical protein